MNKLTLGQFYPGASVVHRLDPRTKFLTLIPLIIAITVNRSTNILLGQYVFLLFLVWISRVPLQLFMQQLRFFILLAFFTFLLHAFLGGGSELFRLPLFGIAVQKEGVILGLFFGMRLLLLVVLSLILMFTTAPTDMTDGFEKLLRPLKRMGLPSDRYAMMLGISFRFLPILFEEAERIQKAQIARGADFAGTLVSRIKGIASVVIPLFISVFHRANALALALEARGFNSSVQRTYYRDLRFRKADFAAVVLVSALTAGVFLI